MSPPDNSPVREILKRFTGINLSEQEINEPAINATGIIDKIDGEDDNLSMDMEPANFTRLLHDLAPNDLK